jgi:hypothetical protein
MQARQSMVSPFLEHIIQRGLHEVNVRSGTPLHQQLHHHLITEFGTVVMNQPNRKQFEAALMKSLMTVRGLVKLK